MCIRDRVNVAPVSAEDKVIIPEKIAEDVYECYKEGAGTVSYTHLDVYKRQGSWQLFPPH